MAVTVDRPTYDYDAGVEAIVMPSYGNLIMLAYHEILKKKKRDLSRD